MAEDNINGNLAHFRDTFLDAEKDYLEELKKNPGYKKFMESTKTMSTKALSKEAISRVADIECGNVAESDLERVEAEITVLFAAIKDAVRIREKGEKYTSQEKAEKRRQWLKRDDFER